MHHIAIGDDAIFAFPYCHGPGIRAIQVTKALQPQKKAAA